MDVETFQRQVLQGLQSNTNALFRTAVEVEGHKQRMAAVEVEQRLQRATITEQGAKLEYISGQLDNGIASEVEAVKQRIEDVRVMVKTIVRPVYFWIGGGILGSGGFATWVANGGLQKLAETLK